MVFRIYKLITLIVLILSPIILVYRLLIKKEDLIRFKEKFSIPTKKRKIGKLIWFHGASVGELLSILPIIRKLEKNKKITQILLTSSTLSSSKVISKFKFKKVVHQFYPLDVNFLTKNFLDYWKPSFAGFIDSEIWPNMITNIDSRSINLFLINARITKNSFKKWNKINFFAKKIFGKFNFALTSDSKSKIYLKSLGVKKLFYLGNLKFSENYKEKKINNNKLKKFLNSKKFWCVSSTHNGEEEICFNTHISIAKKYNNFLTILIPRHVERAKEIINLANNKNLKVHLHSSKYKIDNNTKIYLVDSYGETKNFYNLSKIVYMGGSLIKHGGQNPLEAARYGCKILHGPNVMNFEEIYSLLGKLKISKKIKNINDLSYNLNLMIKKKFNNKKNVKTINELGKNILIATFKKIEMVL